MKTSEDFRRDFGETEERFRACIRQTLTELDCKEDKPVKKKINMGLVLAMIVVLLTGTAIAEEQWGILSFLQSRGKSATEDQLLNLYGAPFISPEERHEHELVDAVITEALYEDGTLYLAVTLTPLKDSTLVVPVPGSETRKLDWGSTRLEHIHPGTFTMQEAMQNAAYGDVSAVDYARAHGFDNVVLLEAYRVSMYSTQNTWLKDEFDGIQYMEYSLLADGTLQVILEVGYQPDLTFADERSDTAGVAMRVWAFDTRDEGEWLYGTSASAHVSFVLPDDRTRLRSIPEDAHDIVGYIGEMDYISIVPYDEENMAITIQLNLRDDATEDIWMTGPSWIIMDEDGNRLCKVDLSKFIGLTTSADPEGNKYSISHGVFPAEFMPKDGKIILRAENRINYNIVYDEYTYTLVGSQMEGAAGE